MVMVEDARRDGVLLRGSRRRETPHPLHLAAQDRKILPAVVAFAQHEHQVVDMREPRAQGVEQHLHGLGKRLGVLAVAPVQAVK